MNEPEPMRELVRKHLQGEPLNAGERRLFALWLQENEDTYDRYKKIWTQAPGLRLHAEVNEAAQWNKLVAKRQRRKTPVWYAAAAVAALLVAAGIYLFIPDDTTVLSNNKDHAGLFVLADSSRVWLNKNSRLEIEEGFNETRRAVRLYGEGFFEVAHNEDKPFVVLNEFSAVKVLGTKFNVISTDSINKIYLLQGSVSFSAGAEQEVILAPGEQGTAGPAGPIAKARIADKNFLSWKTGVLEFNAQPMTYVKHVMESHYQTTLVFSNRRIGRCSVTIAFDNLTLEEALNELGFLLNMEYRIDNNVVVLDGPGCK